MNHNLPEIRQMLAFSAIVDEKSFTNAAKKLNVTQSAVSHSLNALETQLECKLLIRQGRSHQLTPQGEIFLTTCRRIFTELSSAQKIMAA